MNSVLGFFLYRSNAYEAVSFTDGRQLIEEGKVASIEIQDEVLKLVPVSGQTDSNPPKETWRVNFRGDMKSLEAYLQEKKMKYTFADKSFFSASLLSLLSTIFFCAVILFMPTIMKRMAKSQHKQIVHSDCTFEDVAGYETCKEQLQDMIDFLRDPKKFTRLGAEVPSGVLLYGPSGTGKTLLAKAVAGEVGVPFLAMNGSDFNEMFMGVGTGRVRDLFKQARKCAPCVIFIDEVDGIGAKRSDNPTSGGDHDRITTLNALLAEMDGFSANEAVLIIAATNRLASMDSAMLRPGRFDRKIYVGAPTKNVREAILRCHAKHIKVSDTTDLSMIAGMTAGMVGADLAAIVNEATLLATKAGAELVTTEHFLEAIRNIVVGHREKGNRLGDRERKIVAFHESGHAIAKAVLGEGADIASISIMPTSTGALGHNLNIPNSEEKVLFSKSALLNLVCVLLAGRAAEEIQFQDVTSGAVDDLKKANRILFEMITRMGFGKSMPNRVLIQDETEWGDGLQEKVDQEIQTLLTSAYEWALHILNTHKDLLSCMAETLLEHEDLHGEALSQLLAKVQLKPFRMEDFPVTMRN